MNVIAFAGFSGCGKTTLIEKLIPLMRQRGLRVSVVKHAHHGFDIDHPGKDTYRHRAAGAFEVVAASKQRLALLREFETPSELTVHQLLAELYDGVDWVFVEGFKDCDVAKVEVWRAPAAPPQSAPEPATDALPTPLAAPRPVLYPDDDFVVAIATNSAANLPAPSALPQFSLDEPEALADWLIGQGDRFLYDWNLA